MPLHIGRLDKRVTLANLTTPVTNLGDGTYDESYAALSPADVWAAIQPPVAHTLERLFANAIVAVATHLVLIRYHSGVNTKTRVTFGSRKLYVRGVQNVEEKNEQMLLACEEVVA